MKLVLNIATNQYELVDDSDTREEIPMTMDTIEKWEKQRKANIQNPQYDKYINANKLNILKRYEKDFGKNTMNYTKK